MTCFLLPFLAILLGVLSPGRKPDADLPPDVVVYGGTPAGIATAVRASREGMKVILVHYDGHIGGMPSNGLGLFDTVYDGKRGPLGDEIRAKIAAHYLPYAKGVTGYEPHIAEEEFERILAGAQVRVLRGFYPVSAVRRGTIVAAVTFKAMTGSDQLTLVASSFVDASYEGDLAHAAGAEMTVGRESRSTYDETHAGVIFTKLVPTPRPAEESLKLRLFPLMANAALPGSTGAADNAIQAYNFRVCLTRDPADQIPLSKPARYERDLYLALRDRWGFTTRLPRSKTSWNAPLLVGGNFDYPNGDWTVRRAIVQRHRDLALGLLWFLQHDAAVPAKIQAEARQWGLPRDEFADHGGFPWEVYVREGRRLVGRYVFTEHDAEAATGLARAPIHEDSIALTEWPLDSHSCHLTQVPGSDHEGKVLLPLETRPGQIPYRCLLPQSIDNLLVTGCLSSSHIGWGTIRLEPTWMEIGESAAYALVLAKRLRVTPAALPADRLQRLLVDRGMMITFFNDFDMASPTEEERAAEYWGAQGYFSDYDARLQRPLTPGIAAVWAHPDATPGETARRVAVAERGTGTVSAVEFAALTGKEWRDGPLGPLTRGQACVFLFEHPR